MILEKLGLSPSPNGESLSFSYTIIHKIYILDSTNKEGEILPPLISINY